MRQPGFTTWGLFAAIGLLWLAPSLRAQSGVAGTYRCASVQVGNRTGRCLSPPLTLYPDGSYQIWGEQGTYTVQGRRIVLSQAKKRGPGRLKRGRKLVFEFTYRGKKHQVTFLKKYDAVSGSAFI